MDRQLAPHTLLLNLWGCRSKSQEAFASLEKKMTQSISIIFLIQVMWHVGVIVKQTLGHFAVEIKNKKKQNKEESQMMATNRPVVTSSVSEQQPDGECMKKRGWHSSDKREEEREEENEEKKKRGKRKEVASLACTHEGGAKLLQLLPAAASSLQIWGAQLASGGGVSRPITQRWER